MWFDQIWNFFVANWKMILWFLFIIYFLRCVKTSKACQDWFSAQFEWLKLFFSEDKLPNAPSHKNLIGLALVAMFCIAFIKTLVYQNHPEVPDIPSGWQLVVLGILGIRAIQSAAETVADKKFSNGNGFDAKAEIAKIKQQMGYVEPTSTPPPEKP
jgi:hypothetical protein